MGDDRRNPSQILATNLRALMDARRELGTLEAVQHATERKGLMVGKSTVDRVLRAAAPFSLPGLQSLAKVFGVEPWQLITPNLGYGLHRVVGESPKSMALAPVEVPREALALLLLDDTTRGVTEQAPHLPGKKSAVQILSDTEARQTSEVAKSRSRRNSTEGNLNVAPRSTRPVPKKR